MTITKKINYEEKHKTVEVKQILNQHNSTPHRTSFKLTSELIYLGIPNEKINLFNSKKTHLEPYKFEFKFLIFHSSSDSKISYTLISLLDYLPTF